MSYTLNKTGAQIDVILNRATAGGTIDQDIAAEAAARAAADALKAPLASPALTGTPTAPTAAPGTDTTQIATTEFANDAASTAAAAVGATKQDTLSGTAGQYVGFDGDGDATAETPDNTPTAGSSKLVTSDGIAAAIEAIRPKLTATNDPDNDQFAVYAPDADTGKASPKIYGKSAVINQLINRVGASSSTSSGSPQNFGNYGAVFDSSRVYFLRLTVTKSANASVRVRYPNIYNLSAGVFETIVTNAGSVSLMYQISSTDLAEATASIASENVIDLTACGFSSAETTDVATLKAAWLSKFGTPLPQYIPYNAGSVVCNNATYQLHGRNIWDEQWEVGSIDANGQNAYYATAIRSKNLIPVSPNTTYCTASVARNIFEYDANGTFILASGAGGDNLFTTSAQCRYVRFRSTLTYGNTYLNDICINVSDANFNGQYEPYHNGGSVTADDLNGIGTAQDSQDAEGNIVRAIGSVDLGSLTWTALGGDVFSAASGFSAKERGGDCICLPYQNSGNKAAANMPDKTIQVMTGSYAAWVKDSAYNNDKDAFTTAMNGVYLYYELATPTTDTTTAATLATQKGYNALEPISGDVQSADASLTYDVDILAYIANL